MSLFSYGSVHISAKSDYAIKALMELASAGPAGSMTAHAIAERQEIPLRFLLNILADLRRVGVVDSRRGPSGGWWIARPAEEISVADVVRAVDGPLTDVSGRRPGANPELSSRVDELWVKVRSSIRAVLEQTTIADLVADAGPAVAAPAGC